MRYFAFAFAFEGQALVQLVIAWPAMGEVLSSISKCDLFSTSFLSVLFISLRSSGLARSTS